jgi:hypothetical protein
MDEPYDTLRRLRYGRIRGLTRTDVGARIALALPDGGPDVVVVLDGCSELSLRHDTGVVDEPASLVALDLQLTHPCVLPTLHMSTMAWGQGPIRGGALYVVARSVHVEDAHGRHMTERELRAVSYTI